MENVYPQLLESTEKTKSGFKKSGLNLFKKHKQPKLVDKYLVQLNGTNVCIVAQSELSYKNLEPYLEKCSTNLRTQIWKETELGELRMGTRGCLQSSQRKNYIRINKCYENGGTQIWSHDSKVCVKGVKKIK